MPPTRTVIKGLVPPLALSGMRRLVRSRPARNAASLFDGYDSQFKEIALSSTDGYAEFGVGASTIWMAKNTARPIDAVDSSEEWIRRVTTQTDRTENLRISHVDIGPLGNWGRPVDHSRRFNFIDYVEAPFGNSNSVDMVLVDGRMRVACFLTALLRTSPGTRIVFDDYVGRPHYHLVEEFVPRSADDGRQAVFVVPADVDTEVVSAERDRFLYVLD